MKSFNIELVLSVNVNAENRAEAEIKALEEINNNSEAYICIESITPEAKPEIDFTRINNDGNGNPRYVCHFLTFLTDKDEADIKTDFAASLERNPLLLTQFKFDLALTRAQRLGGKTYRGKKYGGGIVFQSYNIESLQKDIFELMAQYK